MSTPSNSNVVPPSQDDDNNNHKRPAEMTVKPLSMSKPKRRKNSGDGNNGQSDQPTVVIVRVKPTIGMDPLGGFVVIPTGYMMDKHATDALYASPKEEKDKEYLSSIQCVNRVLNVYDRLAAPMKNNAGWNRRALAFSFDEDNMTNENIMAFVNDTFSPAIWNHIDKTYYTKVTPDDLPKVKDVTDTTVIYEVNNWSDVIIDDPNEKNRHDVGFTIAQICKSVGTKLKDYIKEDSDHLYTFYKEGEVPLDFMIKNHIEHGSLKEADRERLLEHNAAKK